ncbi:MAG TPA: hypothetical protein VFO46_23175 [Candidatus Sulfotelmatobacter sp.]|nr:hypothetical protein [Candidatus Sulfotelmatobacter sp.]
MRVLLVHPEDNFDALWGSEHWDLIVDLGKAPRSFYEAWSRSLGCRVFSIFDLAIEIDDLKVWRNLLRAGMGCVVDRFGIDWWDVLSLTLQPELQDMRLVSRLAEQLRQCSELVVSRPSIMAHALHLQLRVPLTVRQSSLRSRFATRVMHYGEALHNLSFRQVRQVVYDKYDVHYAWRRNFSTMPARSAEPLVLLPSAYSNVTKTALQYTRSLPDQRFLVVLARESGAVSGLPANVTMAPLAAFAKRSPEISEVQQLEDRWTRLEQSLQEEPDFRLSLQVGLLTKARNWLSWGLTVRDAWEGVFGKQSIVGCLSADDSNPNTRIPLLLARHRGIPTVSCHHGALDSSAAFKAPCSSIRLAQGEMERDYLERVCGVNAGTIRVGAPISSSENRLLWKDDSPWIVFFTEPYEAGFWRAEAVYRDVLPRLCALARKAGKSIVLKVHPFETARQRRRLVKKILNEDDQKLAVVMEAPLSSEILSKTWCAVTVESTVALQCAVAGIPVFLCGWMRHAYSGYALQYVRFGLGYMMESPGDLLRIPQIMNDAMRRADVADRVVQAISSSALAEILLRTPARSLVS